MLLQLCRSSSILEAPVSRVGALKRSAPLPGLCLSEAIEALAEAWASLDGKLDEFLAGRGGEDTEGDYHGYLSDAAELAKRLEHRGYLIVRAPRDT